MRAAFAPRGPVPHPRVAVRRGLLPSGAVLVAVLSGPSLWAQALPHLPGTQVERLDRSAQPQTVPVTRPATLADLDAPRTLSLTFPRPAAIRDVLSLLVRGTPLSVVVDSGVRAAFSGELRNLTVRQALEAVLFQARLDYDVRGTVIRVFPRRTSTRFFTLDLPAVRRSWSAASGGARSSLTTSAESDPYAEIDRGVAALLSGEGRHHVDRRAGLVQVTDFADRLDQVALYLETVQLRASRQVRIEARVFRVALRDGSLARDPAGAPSVAADLNAAIASLQSAGEATLVAAPSLLAMNNEAALVTLDEAAVPGAAGSAASPTALSLVVTPQISADGFIHLSVAPRVDAGAAQSVPDPPVAFAADTIVRLREGETVMISGLPSGRGRRTEWVVLLTPTLVTARTIQAGVR